MCDSLCSHTGFLLDMPRIAAVVGQPRLLSPYYKMTKITYSIQGAPISDPVLHTIYDCDQALYPAPLAFARLQSWRDACPELSILCRTRESESVDVGAIIVLPLQKHHWEDLLVGKLKETSIEASMFAPSDADGAEVGLHVFHVERFESNVAIRGLTKLSLALIQDVAKEKRWKVIGYSGKSLAVYLTCSRRAQLTQRYNSPRGERRGSRSLLTSVFRFDGL